MSGEPGVGAASPAVYKKIAPFEAARGAWKPAPLLPFLPPSLLPSSPLPLFLPPRPLPVGPPAQPLASLPPPLSPSLHELPRSEQLLWTAQ